MLLHPQSTSYIVQIRPSLEYGSHLWRGASKHSLVTLDATQKRAIKLIGDPALIDSLDSLARRGTISALSLYYRYYHGVCSVELKSINSPKAVFTRNTRFSNAQHPFAVKLDKNRPALSPTPLSLWPPEIGTHSQPPSSPRLITFSCLRPTYTDTFNSYPAHKILSSSAFHDGGANQSHKKDSKKWLNNLGDGPFWCISFSHQYKKKKKKSKAESA